MATTLDEITLAQQPGALSLEQQQEKDDQDEWEYEYSTTETETYYLTIELSYPEFKDRQSRAIHHSRGGYYKHWLDQTPGQLKAAAEADEGENENDDEPLPEPEADDDEPDIDPELQGKGKEVDRGDGDADDNDKAPGEDEEAEDIQILDLHSDKPIISYKGRVFEGQWAEVIGTEAIFANRDNDNPLPALRHLDKNLDLLGASASRILTTEKLLKPKVPKEDPLAAIREEWNIRIPVGKDRTGERAQQTRFLENLIALKKKKGETDQVTVYAKDGEGKDFKDSRDPDYKPRRRRRILNEDGEEVIPKRERRRGGRRRTGRPRVQGGRGRGAATVSTPATESNTQSTGLNTLSTPTPRRWEELYEREEEEDDDDEDDDDDGDEEMEDRSDSDEDEDMSMMD